MQSNLGPLLLEDGEGQWIGSLLISGILIMSGKEFYVKDCMNGRRNCTIYYIYW